MSKTDILLEPGHGGSDPGAVGPTGIKEKDCTLKIAKRVGTILESAGVAVGYIRTDDVTMSLNERCAIANKANARYLLSIHINSAANPAATGTETYSYPGSSTGAQLAKAVQKNLVAAIGLPDRGAKTANFQMLRETSMPAALTEVCFICNPKEEALLKTDAFLDKAALGIATGVLDFLGIQPTVPRPTPAGETIMGASVLSSAKMAAYLLSKNPSPKIAVAAAALAEAYIAESAAEGVRGDIAFCQAIKETGWFAFGGDVKPEQNNYAGIGAVGGGAGGASFPTPQIGVRAQIQHLKAYGTTSPLNQACVDPRFSLVSRGIAPCWIDLNGRWAVPGAGYGESILQLYEDMVAFSGGLPEPAPDPSPSPEPEAAIPVLHFCSCGNTRKITEGVYIGGVLYAPLRVLCEEFGHTVDWNQDSRKVTVK